MIELTEVYIRYNPYRLTTTMTINGNPLSEDSSLAQAISGKRLQSWISSLPEMLKNERGSREFQIRFHGNALDYDDVKDSFEQARKKGIISDYHTMCEEAVGDSDVYESILRTYNDLMGDPYFTDSLSKSDREGLESAIKRVQNNIFPIHVIATMSSGKSTLINALLRRKLMPSKNEACTAIITEILDDDGKDFSAIVYDRSDNEIKTIAKLTYDIMNELNSNEDISRVSVEGNIPFLEVTETRLKLVDTPGPNNARNQNHRETTYRNINSATENMILYVLNYTQLATNDDENLLRYVAEEIRKGGKETRDRFIFVLNKMDAVTNDDSIAHAIDVTKAYLAKHGIDDPQIFPCSAFAALGIRTLLTDIDPYDSDAVDDAVEKYNNYDIADVADLVRKINRKKDKELYLEQYSTLTPSEQEKLRNRLVKAKEMGDRKTEALIHSGICSVESAIKAYVQKYAKAKKIRDFVEPLEEQLHQAEKETRAKLDALSGGEKAVEIQRRSQAICDMIQQGEEAKTFKKKIEAIDPVPEIKTTAEKLIDAANIQLTKRFKHLGEKIEGRQNALNFINAFSDDAAEVLSSLSAQLEILVEKEITETGTELILAYQAKLEGFDNSVGSNLDFSTSDLVSGVLSRMKTSAIDYSPTGSKRSQQESDVDDVHQDEVEEYTVDVIKTKKIKKTIQDGVKRVKTGEERVVVGTHKEKVGMKRVEKPRRGLFSGLRDKLFGMKYEEVPEYKEFEDVEYRPTYDYVPKMKEIIEEIPTIEQETREKIHYVVPVADLQRKLVTPIRQQLDSDVEELIKVATSCIENLKTQFLNSFDEVDELIESKYSELESYTQQQEELEQRKNECKSMLTFIQDNLKELADALNV